MYRLVLSFIYLLIAVFNARAQHLCSDTIEIVLDNEWLFYPFGKYAYVNAIKHNLPLKTYEEYPITENGDSLIVGKDGNDKIALFKDREGDAYDTTFMIVYADINSNKYRLKESVYVGQKKSQVCRCLKIKCTEVNHIRLISAVQGVWIYLNFKGDVLTNILIKTDYDFSKYHIDRMIEN